MKDDQYGRYMQCGNQFPITGRDGVGMRNAFFAEIIRFRNKSAFSLLELLAAISLVGLLSVMIGPAVSSLAMGGKSQKALIDIAGAFEKAREHAVAKNTHVYVGFTAPNERGEVVAGIFGSSNGLPEANLSQASVVEVGEMGNTEGRSVVLLDRLMQIEDTRLQDDIPVGNALAGNAKLGSAPSFLSAADSAIFRYRSGTDRELNFVRLIHFTPEGEARVSAFTPESVRLVVVQVKGGVVADEPAASVIEVSGLTGQIAVYRPGSF
jgi:prepilin-type N-terminal cleavage/methylation domain-containing protein